MKKQRKKQAQILFFVMLALFLLTSWSIKHKTDTTLSNEDFIRFHVIANSDTEEDQSLKLIVRDRVLESINRDLVDYTVREATGEELQEVSTEAAMKVTLDKEDVEEYIGNHLKDIEEKAEQIIAEEGYAYTASAELGVRWIPRKTYGNVTFPAGNYEALNIVIGEGKGQNWWCVLFPPLCLIGAEDPAKPETETCIMGTPEHPLTHQDPRVAAVYRNSIPEEKYRELMTLLEESEKQGHEEQSTTLKLRFKSLDWIEEKTSGL